MHGAWYGMANVHVKRNRNSVTHIHSYAHAELFISDADVLPSVSRELSIQIQIMYEIG